MRAWALGALLALAPPGAHASFDGMASGNFRVPYSVQDGNGNTHQAVQFRSRSSGSGPFSTLPGGNLALGFAFHFSPGYLQRLPSVSCTPSQSPSASPSSSPSATPTASRTATPSSSPSPTLPGTFTHTPTLAGTFTPTPTPTGTFSVTPTRSPTCTPTHTATASPSATPSQTHTATGTSSGSPTSTVSATNTRSPSATATVTPALGPPQPAFTLHLDRGDLWFGGNELRYTFSVTNTAGSPVDDLTLVFDSDLNSGNIGMSVGNSPNFTGVKGPASWGPVSFVDPSKGVIMGPMLVNSGASLSFPVRRIFSQVLGPAIDTTITARAVLSSAGFGFAITRTVSSYIRAMAPSPTPQPSITSTPIAFMGQMACYPQPARDQLCFGYQAPAGGELRIRIYNIAMQLVAELKDSSQGGFLERSCADVSGIAPGVYFYRATAGGYAFPLGQFGIAR